MSDLTIGYAVITCASLLACFLGARVAWRTKGIVRTLLIAALVALVLTFAIKIQGHLVLARWFPFSNAILVSNMTVVGAWCLAGFILGWRSIPLWRRLVFGTAIGAVGVVALLNQMPRNPPLPGDEWVDEVCMQTNKASCSACAAATLLVDHGMPANEAEMMKLCLTGAEGTPSLGLYRGLKLKTASTPYEVVTFHTDIESLLDSKELPAILLVMLELGADVDPRYEEQWGWTPGLGHAVVYYGRVGTDRIMIGDPSVGRERWTLDDLRVLWQGDGVRLHRR